MDFIWEGSGREKNDKQISKHKQYQRGIGAIEESYGTPDKQWAPLWEDSVHDMRERSQVPEDKFEDHSSRENIWRWGPEAPNTSRMRRKLWTEDSWASGGLVWKEFRELRVEKNKDNEDRIGVRC